MDGVFTEAEEGQQSWLEKSGKEKVIIKPAFQRRVRVPLVCWESPADTGSSSSRIRVSRPTRWLKQADPLPASTWISVLVLAPPRPIQLCTYGLGKPWRIAQVLGTLHCHGRPERSPWLQIIGPDLNHCGHLENER